MSNLSTSIDALLRSIVGDEDRHGGPLLPDTIRRADDPLCSLVSRNRSDRGEPNPAFGTPLQPRGAR